MKTLATFALVLISNAAISGTSQSGYECLSSIMEANAKFSRGDIYSILLKCQDDDGCPFSSGFYDKENKNILLPMKNNGNRGVVFYTPDGSSYFVPQNTKGIKNDEERYTASQVNDVITCTKVRRVYGVAGYSENVGNFIADIADYFNSDYIGYDIEKVDTNKCESSPTNNGTSLVSDETQELINSAIYRNIKSMSYLWLNHYLKTDRKNVVYNIQGCEAFNSPECYVTAQQKFNDEVAIMRSCAEKTKDTQLREFINEKLQRMNSLAVAIGLIDAQDDFSSDNNASGSAARN